MEKQFRDLARNKPIVETEHSVHDFLLRRADAAAARKNTLYAEVTVKNATGETYPRIHPDTGEWLTQFWYDEASTLVVQPEDVGKPLHELVARYAADVIDRALSVATEDKP